MALLQRHGILSMREAGLRNKVMDRLRRVAGFPCRHPRATSEWPDDGSWIPLARLCRAFQLDAGYAVTPFVPSWMLPAGAADDPTISLPNLPRVAGHVLTIDTIGRESELVRYYSQLPSLPGWSSRRETAPFCSLPVNLLLDLPGEDTIVADLFAGSRQAAAALLDELSDETGSGGIVYDNLDQGWALRILVEDDAVLVLDWNWEVPDPRESARALRLSRHAVAAEARAARHRLDHIHGTLLGALGRDLWSCPARD